MPIIRNNLSSRMLIHTKDSKYIDLLEKSTAEITDDDLLSSHLQGLIQRGFVIMEKEARKEVKKEEKVENLCKEQEVNTEEKVENPSETKEVDTEEKVKDLSEEKEVDTAEK